MNCRYPHATATMVVTLAGLYVVVALLAVAPNVEAAGRQHSPMRRPTNFASLAATPRHAPRPKAHAIKLSALPDSAAVMALLTGVSNGACPLAGVATGGQPDSAHVAALARAGFATVLDLRAAGEPRGFDEAAAMRAAGLDYVRLPVTPATLDDRAFDAFRAAMQRRGGQRVFVHCASGNRVGAAMIPWLVLERGWDLERAVTSARAGGLKSPEMEAKARDYVSRKRAPR